MIHLRLPAGQGMKKSDDHVGFGVAYLESQLRRTHDDHGLLKTPHLAGVEIRLDKGEKRRLPKNVTANHIV